MARTLRIERTGGRYHVTARGNERKPIYRRDTDRAHFLALVGKATEDFGIRVHGYVLMDNHYHLLVETPEANLSRTMQWLNVSYSVWFNRRHDRAGHLLQGRFESVVVEDDGGWQEVARYIHLNPVRVAGLALNKGQQAASRRTGVAAPSAELVAQRLSTLREYRWSSYRSYAGLAVGVGWLWRQPLDRICGGKTESERRVALRQYTEEPVRQGGHRSAVGAFGGGADFRHGGLRAAVAKPTARSRAGAAGNAPARTAAELVSNRGGVGASQRRELEPIRPAARGLGSRRRAVARTQARAL